eukprot:scaffold499834_cov25-Prasinocladus_malaysianus.AAC.1
MGKGLSRSWPDICSAIFRLGKLKMVYIVQNGLRGAMTAGICSKAFHCIYLPVYPHWMFAYPHNICSYFQTEENKAKQMKHYFEIFSATTV